MESVLELVFAPGCAACDRRTRAPFCEVCAVAVEPAPPGCPRCGQPARDGDRRPCGACEREPPPFEQLVAPLEFGGEVATALRRLKFHDRRDLARPLAALLAPGFAQAAEGCDLAVPVPLHRARLAARRTNQAALLARHLCRPLGLPLDLLSLRRVRATAPQTGLDRAARQANVRGAFAVAPGRRSRIAGCRVLLVDDVATTGATLREAAAALRAAGATAVVSFCAARAV